VREREARIFSRARNPDAAQNHQLAIAASPDRRLALRGLAIATLVIHGDEDPILPLAHGRATAEAIPAARFLEIRGMGHDLGPAHTERVTEALLAHTAG
jgi:pimeloyl-ACP methyl ester carboxylesterase